MEFQVQFEFNQMSFTCQRSRVLTGLRNTGNPVARYFWTIQFQIQFVHFNSIQFNSIPLNSIQLDSFVNAHDFSPGVQEDTIYGVFFGHGRGIRSNHRGQTIAQSYFAAVQKSIPKSIPPLIDFGSQHGAQNQQASLKVNT